MERVESDRTIGARLTLQAGDFFRGRIPSCDAYMVMEALHDWTDEQSQ